MHDQYNKEHLQWNINRFLAVRYCLPYLVNIHGLFPRTWKLKKTTHNLILSLTYMTHCLIIVAKSQSYSENVSEGVSLAVGRPRDVTWSLWNPITSEIIILPSLNHRGSEGDCDDIRYCCLSAPPDHPSSVLLLSRTNKLNLVYCRLGSDSSFPNTCRKQELRWTEMTYAKQVRSITSFDDCYLYSLTSCNGRVYAYLKVTESNSRPLLVEIKMMVKYGKRKNLRQVITLLPISEFDCPTLIDSYGSLSLLKGSSTELFTIVIGVKDETSFSVGDVKLFKLNMQGSSTELFTIVIGVKDETSFSVGDVKLFKLNMNSKVWEEMDDLK
nr:hypothetical protein [Tanacetum cinerariifolium]